MVAKHRKVHLFDIDIPGKQTFKVSLPPSVLEKGYGLTGLGIRHSVRRQEPDVFHHSFREDRTRDLL